MSSWDTTTGLLEKFQLVTEKAWFGTNDRYQSGTVLLLNLQGPASVDGEIANPEHLVMFSCGDNWKAAGGGASAVNTQGSDGFNAASQMGRLIDGIKNLGQSALQLVAGKGESFEADTWQGLVIDFERQKTGDFTDRETGERRDIFSYVPLSVTSAEGMATPQPAAAASAPSAASSKALRVQVVNFAKKHDDYDSFLAAVLDPGEFNKAEALEADEELLDDVVSGADGSSVWQEAHPA